MGEFIVAHKIALLLIGAALGGFILLTRGKGAQAATGYPVDPYAGGSPASSAGAGGGFDISSLLPSGPAGPALDPSAPAAPASSASTAGEAPAAVDNSPAVASSPDSAPSNPNIFDAPPANYDTALTYIIPGAAGAPPTYFQPPGYFQNEQGYQKLQSPDAVDRYLANTAGYDPFTQTFATPSLTTTAYSSGPGTAPAVSLPIASVDLTPRPTVGHAVAV